MPRGSKKKPGRTTVDLTIAADLWPGLVFVGACAAVLLAIVVIP